MSDPLIKPFTKAEMEAMREANRDGEGLKRRFWDKLKRVAGRIPFAEDLVAAYFCTLDPATPSRVRSPDTGSRRIRAIPSPSPPVAPV